MPDTGDSRSSRGSGESSGRRVRALPDALIDQIAAGEVVERPASVVKELVENALDAGAGRVRVEIRAGGLDWIAVTDDGSGMSPDDARLALQRHATSKIADADDLQRIDTFGFRGEALPAIASVSQLRLRTREADAPEAFEIRVDAGRRVSERSAAGPPGTRIEVADLFANVPARRKFLKKPTTEWGHVADWLTRSALALPDVHFDIRRDDRPALVWPATREPLDRIAAVISEDDAASFVPVSLEEGGVGLEGFVSRPDRHRASMSGIYWFVNRRPVRDRLLRHALVEVYRDLLPRGRFPAAVLFLSVPLERVDVNVHPAKWEVRFDDPRAVHQLVRRGVRAAIEQRSWIAPPAGDAQVPGPARAWSPGAPSSSFSGGRPPPTHSGSAHGADSRGDWLFAERGVEPEALEMAAPVRFGELPRLGQLLATYLVLETKDGLVLVDQHAAHERVLYERLRAEWRERGVESQGLLAPVTVPLDPLGRSALGEHAEDLARLGFDVESFGDDTVVVRAIPALLSDRDPAALVRELADELTAAGEGGDLGSRESRALDAADRTFASLACHSARRKGEVLDPREQQALLDALDAIPWAPTCPHGRPVAAPFDLAEIERRFLRR